MKKAIYRFTHPAVFDRAFKLKRKQIDRARRLRQAMDYMNQWPDIPISWQYPGLCKILKIKPTQAEKDFLLGLNFGKIDIEKEARKLPLV